MNEHIMIIDDEENLAFFLAQSLELAGYKTSVNHTIADARKAILAEFPDLLLLDLNLPDGGGRELHAEIKKKGVDIPTIVITAHGSIQSAIDALKQGVDEYIIKPFDMKQMLHVINKLLERYRLRIQLNYFRSRQRNEGMAGYFISHHPQMKMIHEIAIKVSSADSAVVLIEGPTGSGKEMLARFIHNNTKNPDTPFIEINCASLPGNLLESELFGYEPGAFTDARKRKIGLIELAEGGTLFFDEVTEMPIGLQAKLLRYIETKKFRRLGGVREIETHLRIIAATNENVGELVEQGQFRRDLYFRLNMFEMKLPDLKSRRDEILIFAQYFLQQINTRLRKTVRHFSEDSQQILHDYDWPGNVRELHNVIERAVILCDRDTILPVHLPQQLLGSSITNPLPLPSLLHLEQVPLRSFIEQVEQTLLRQAMNKSKGNQLQAAKLLNEPRHIIRYLLKKHGMEVKK